MKNYKFSYDKEFDDLFIFDSNSKSKGSVELGDIILDFNTKKEFVGIQLMNASRLLQDISGEINIDIILEHLKECRIETITKNNLLIIKIFLIRLLFYVIILYINCQRNSLVVLGTA